MSSGEPLLLIYHQHLAASDGTSVQMVRLLENAGWSILHLHGRTDRRRPLKLADYRPVFLPTSFSLRKRRGYFRLLRLWHKWFTPGLARWRALTVGPESAGLKSAYVVIYNEDQALFADAVLRAWNRPRYVLHLMDLMVDPVGPEFTPGLVKLLGNAAAVLVTAPRLGATVAPWSRVAPVTFPLATGLHLVPPLRTAQRQPRLLMCGGLYGDEPHRTEFLRGPVLSAWRRFNAEFPEARWVYAGPDTSDLGELAAYVTPLGRLDDADYAQTLRTARCALVPVVHQANEPWRYSVPSRLVDFLAAGLPALVPTAPGTAADDFAIRHAAHGIERVATEMDVYAALTRVFRDETYHTSQATAAYLGAQEHNLDVVRAALKSALTADL
jgi:hypothetical protein